MVRGLVEGEPRRLGEHEERKRESRALAPGQGLDHLLALVAPEEELGQVITDLLVRHLGVVAANFLERRVVVAQVRRVLVVVGDPRAVSADHFAREGSHAPGDDLHQRRFASAVRANDAHALSASNADVHVLEEDVAFVAAEELLRVEHAFASARGLGGLDEGSTHVVVRLLQTSHVGQLLGAALGLCRALATHVLLDERILLLQHLLLLLVRADLCLVLLSLELQELGVVAVVGDDLAALELDDAIDAVREEPSIVAHDQHAGGEVFEVAL